MHNNITIILILFLLPFAYSFTATDGDYSITESDLFEITIINASDTGTNTDVNFILGELSYTNVSSSQPDANIGLIYMRDMPEPELILEVPPLEKETTNSQNIHTCSYINGTICSEDDSCSGKWIYVSDTTKCCSGICLKKEKSIDNIFLRKENILLVKNNYIPLQEENLPILDQTDTDLDLQIKRIATKTDVIYSRELRILGLFGLVGPINYENIFTLEIKNISNQILTGIKLIDAIPKEFSEKNYKIESNNIFTVIEEGKVIAFLIDNLKPGETKTVSYSFTSEGNIKQLSKEDFDTMDAPIALINLKDNDLCMKIYCNDYNPCTRDYCLNGECIIASMNNGAKCGEKMICQNGTCIIETESAEKTTSLFSNLKTNLVIVILLLFIVSIYLSRKGLNKGKKLILQNLEKHKKRRQK